MADMTARASDPQTERCGIRGCSQPISGDPHAKGLCEYHLERHNAAWCDARLACRLPGRLL
jgi:hypothetical protein